MNDETPLTARSGIAHTLSSPGPALDPAKFQDPDRTAKGEKRASVPLVALRTLWFNTGTLCNISCVNCYIESTPTNDRLIWLTYAYQKDFLREVEDLSLPVEEVGFTGGEPFMNPDTPQMITEALKRGYRALVLTNAMRPMMRPAVQKELLAIRDQFGDRLTLRISLDHYTETLHDAERGGGSFAVAMKGVAWLAKEGFKIDIAGRTCFHENEDETRAGFARLFKAHGVPVDALDPVQLMLFPEMDPHVDVPEITTACWDILGKDPADIMCASSRMIVHRKGETHPKVLPCTLLAYGEDFEMGETLAESLSIDTSHFDKGAVKLNHPHCAKFCVLGGGSCSA